MKHFHFDIVIEQQHGFIELIGSFEQAFEAVAGDSVYLNIDFNNVGQVLPQHLGVITSLVKYLRQKWIKVSGVVKAESDDKNAT